MKISKILILTLFLASAGFAQDIVLKKDVIACGGSASSSLTLRSNCTLGQAISGESSSLVYTIKSGFWMGGVETGPGGCDYAVGDVNGDSGYNGIDISYGVSYFKGGSQPLCGSCSLCPGWYYCGDVNGSCFYNGLDITYGVAYFKGGAAPVPCADCPPGGVIVASSERQIAKPTAIKNSKLAKRGFQEVILINKST